MTIEVAVQVDAPGATVKGIVLQDISRPEVREKLLLLWRTHGLLVFSDVEGEQLHVGLTRIFGTPIAHTVRSVHATNPILTDLVAEPGDSDIEEIAGERRAWYLPWHSDLIYIDEINRGGILRPIELPRSGSYTGFMDKGALYERLPVRLRNEIADLGVLYQANFQPEDSRFGIPPRDRPLRNISMSSRKGGENGAQNQMKNAPRVIHPMVFTHPDNGRKMLNVSPWFAVGIEGRENAEGDRLLSEVIGYIFSAAEEPGAVYRHEWKYGEMVLWDNWRMLHSTPGTNPAERRHMQRTTLAGDYCLGRKENPDEVIEQRFRRGA